MQENSPGSGTPGARVPRGAAKLPRTAPAARPRPTAKPSVDKFPKDPAEWMAFAALPADERSAIYLRSIRAMLLFFTVLTVIGMVSTIVLLLIGIGAAHDSTGVSNYPLG